MNKILKIRKGTAVFTTKAITNSIGDIIIPKGSLGIFNYYNPKMINYHIIFDNVEVKSMNQGEFKILTKENFITSIENWLDID